MTEFLKTYTSGSMFRIFIIISVISSSFVFGKQPEGRSRFFKIVPLDKIHQIFGKPKRKELDPSLIRVLVWNVKKTQEVSWASEFKDLASDKDLLLIQEAFDNDHFVETLLSFRDVRWDMGKSFTYNRYNNHATGTMIGSKAEPTEVIIKHSPDYEPVTVTPKSLAFAKYKIKDVKDEVLVVSVHGINFDNFQAFVRNMQQLKTQISLHKGPVIVAGDFNTRTKTRLNYVYSMMKELGTTPVEFEDGDKRMVAIYTDNFLDHGFVRGFEVLKAKVFADSMGSDHKPMTMELSYCGESCP